MDKITLMLTAILLLASALSSNAYTINDNYVGANPTHNWAHTDVIGDSRYYDIAGMDVNTSGSRLKVDIYSSFVAQTSSSTIWSERTKIGDLFIGTGGWAPNGEAPYRNDNASNSGTNWDYAVVFDKHVPTSNGDATVGGSVKVYSTKDGAFVKSNLGGLSESNWVYRADQYVQFTPDSNASAIAMGTWGINRNWNQIGGINYGDLWLDFDYSTISAMGSDWAFHWAMTCGNDVIEGETRVPPVPEPGTIVLLGAGLLGLGFFYKRRINKA